jgi:uncharacterized protein (TIGR03437 family)
MRQIIRISVLLTIILLSIHTTESYVRIRTVAGTLIAWDLVNPSTPIVSNGRVTYNLDSAGSDDLPFCEVERAITSSFQSWEDIPTSIIAFQRGPNISSTSNSPGIFEIRWVENSTIVDDGADISGALAVSFIESNDGEITDVAIVFNGRQFPWATDGRETAIDVQDVATHEIGHCIGLDHSPNAGATMFPRPGIRRQRRTLLSDDQIAASVIYPAPDFASSTGNISGRVLDNSGVPIFGAHIGVVGENGIAITGALSQPDGTYSIQGLPPGSYTIYAEPLDSDISSYFNRFNLSSFYSFINTDFQTSSDFPVSVNPGAITSLDIPVIRGTPAFDVALVVDSSGDFAANFGSSLTQGQNNVSVGVLGRFLPQSGSPLTISGPGITINQIFFMIRDGLSYVVADVNVSPTAPIGPRNIIIDNGVQRTIVTGGLEITSGPVNPSVTSIVSQTHFAPLIAPESLATAFGSNLATATATPSCSPAATSLAGTSILIRDSLGNERSAPLMYVSPTQINFQIPPGIQPGTAFIRFTNGTGGTFTTTLDIEPVAPGLFTLDGSGSGLPVGFLIRFRADGTTSQEPIARFDPELGEWVPVPIDMGPESDRILLVLFGTGFRFPNELPSVAIGGVPCEVVYAGREGSSFPFRDQVNMFLPRILSGAGAANVALTVDGSSANTVTVTFAGSRPSVTSIVSQTHYAPLVAVESLATAFGSNLATTTAIANSNPLPTSLAGTTISLRDLAGNIASAQLIYVSPTQINFRIPTGIQPGIAFITFTNGTGGAITTTLDIQPVAPGLFTLDGSGSGLPNGFVVRFRADGTSSQEPIANFNPELGEWVPVPIDLGPESDRVLLVLFGTGFRSPNELPSVTIGGMACEVVYAGREGGSLLLRDQLNVFLNRSITRGGPVNVEMTVDEKQANTVSVSIQ